MARKAFTKAKYPGKWGPAVAGTVEDREEIKPEWFTFEQVKEMCLKKVIKENMGVAVLLRFLVDKVKKIAAGNFRLSEMYDSLLLKRDHYVFG